jgi:hypothetical protein
MAQFFFCSSVPNDRIEATMMPSLCGLKLWYTRRRDSFSACARTWGSVAFRPPYSGGWPGSSQPWSNWARCHRRVHSGMCALDRDGSVASSAVGRYSSRNALNSARGTSRPPGRCRPSRRHVRARVVSGSSGRFGQQCLAVRRRGAEQQVPGHHPLEVDLQLALSVASEPPGAIRTSPALVSSAT